MHVLGYLRVSTREQADSGLGLDAQRRAIADEAERRGWTVRWIVDDGFTARNLRRPGVQEAFTALRRREGSALVVAKLDRLSRSLPDFGSTLDLAKRQGWALVALDLGVDMTTPNGRLVASIIAAVAEWESATIGRRTADAMAEAKSRGAQFGRQRMAPREVVDRIMFQRYGGESCAAIATSLDRDNIATPNGGARWYPSTVERLIKAEQRLVGAVA
jgi:DNA invertase Pin-like site-specific DNA recombinase